MDRSSRRDMVLQMLEKEPGDVFLNYALAMEYLANNEVQHANDQLLKVLALDPDHLPCYYQLGKVNEALNLNEQAIVYYKLGVELAKKQDNRKALGELNEALWMLDEE